MCISYLLLDITVEQEHSQCPLVERGTITSLFIVYIYDSRTRTFTVPPGGDGYYYFSAYFHVYYYEYAVFDIQINGEVLCTAYTDEQQNTAADYGQAACSAATYATEGE